MASVETNYRWDAGYTVLNEEDDSGDLERTFVGRNTAQIEGDDAATGDYFYHTHDHLGSTRNVYAQNKDDAAAFEYTPYGRELFATNRALTTRGYTGHTREAALGGGYYAPFRYYLPNLARWEKRDPLGMVDGPNVYGYVRGNVVNLVDSVGLCRERGESIRQCFRRMRQHELDCNGRGSLFGDLAEFFAASGMAGASTYVTYKMAGPGKGLPIGLTYGYTGGPHHIVYANGIRYGRVIPGILRFLPPAVYNPITVSGGIAFGAGYTVGAWARPEVNAATACLFACDGNSTLGRIWSKMPDWIR